MKLSFELIDLFLVSPAICLFVFSLIPVMIKVFNNNKEISGLANVGVSMFGVLASIALTAGVVVYQIIQGHGKTVFDDALIIDGVSMLSSLLVAVITGFTLLMARESVAIRGKLFSEFCFLLLNAAVGMMIVAWARDMIVMFIGIELMSLCLYVMIAMSNEEVLSKEAAIKYFVLGSFASAILLYGMAFIYGAVGSTYLKDIAQVAAELTGTNRIFVLGVALAIVGLGFKVSLFPFHSWTPDVYHGSPTVVTAFMAAGVKAVVFVAFLRFILTGVVIDVSAIATSNALQWLAVFTMFAGNLLALKQNSLKRMLAYSSISHSGYIMVGLIAAGSKGGQFVGSTGVLFYVFSYAIMTVGSFGVISLFERSNNVLLSVDKLKGLANRQPYTALCITIFMLSLAGIPPTVGFFGKYFLFAAAIKQGLYWLAVWGVMNSVISVYYYLRPVVCMYMSDEEGANITERQPTTYFTVLASALLVLFLGITSGVLYDVVHQSVKSMF